MKKYLFILLAALMMSCNQRGCEKMKKHYQLTDRYYHIRQYSGGKLVNEYKFKGMVNDAEGSDGYYFTVNDTLVELSGDLEIRSY